MDRDRSGVWFSVAGVALSLAALALGASAYVRDTSPRVADRLLLATGAFAVVGVACTIVGVVARVRHPRVKFQTHAVDQGAEAHVSLFRGDGQMINDSRCRITRRRWHRSVRHSQPEDARLGSARPTFAYPADFESRYIDGVLGKGRYAVVWETRVRNDKTGLMEWKRVARGRFRVTDELQAAAQRLRERGTWMAGSEVREDGARLWLRRRELPIAMFQCEVRMRHRDGSLGEAYVGHDDGNQAREVALEFPDEFRREVAQTRRLTPGAGIQIDRQYENATGEPGNYEVLWKAGREDPYLLAVALESTVNNTSLMLLIQMGRASLLFPGDSQWGTWDRVLQSPEGSQLLTSATFYKVGHHGSYNATPRTFVETLLKNANAMVSVAPTSIPSWKDIPKAELLTELVKQGRCPVLVNSHDQTSALPAATLEGSGLIREIEVPV